MQAAEREKEMTSTTTSATIEDYCEQVRKSKSGLSGLRREFYKTMNPKKYYEKYRKDEIEMEHLLGIDPF